jgi:hypothetical protein
MAKLGLNAKLYRNTSTYEAPSWSEVTLISDLSVNPSWDEADASARESRVKQSVKTLMALEVSGRLKKKPLDGNYEAFMDALLSDDVLDLLVLDGDKDTEGNRGWRCDFQVFSANEDQGMGNALYEEISLKPSITDHAAKAARIGSGGSLTYSVPGEDGGTFA